MKTLHIKKTAAFCKRLFRLERNGQYEKALTELEDIWQDKNRMPDVENLESKLAAEVLLRCGSLIGFFGHNKQIPKSQETSKNLLSEARSRFLDMYNFEKVAECENYIALAYWRTGELNEAEVWIEESLSRNLPNSNEIKLHSVIINCLIFLSQGKNEDNLNCLEAYEQEFLLSNDNGFKGDFFNHYGLALQTTGRIKEALAKLNLARHYHQKSKHQIYLGTVENNLAQTYKLDKNFPKAHESVDTAAKIFKQIKDRTREGFCFDTKAQIFFAEEKYDKSLEAVEKAVKILKLSENAAYLVETYLTKIKTLLYLDRFTDAAFCLVEAVQTAQTNISEAAAENLTAEFEKVLKLKEAQKINQAVIETVALYADHNLPVEKKDSEKAKTSDQEMKSDEDLELCLMKELANYDSQDLSGVWISSTDLEVFGLTRGSFALLVKGEVKRGELAAIEEKESSEVSCGFYDTEFGLISLETADGELRLFDADQFRVLGKIVGIGKDKTTDGKLIIEPIDLP